jgi:ABC-type Mn2+/Zn2+ transport system ATPase subunit
MIGPSQTDLALRASELSLGYGNKTVLGAVNLAVRCGEFWFFLGPNGSGKTTLIRAILGVLRPRAGSLWLHPVQACRERIGFVPQRCDLNPTLPTTVREFVLLGLVGIAGSNATAAERLTWALETVGLGGLEERGYWTLSGGQRQRALVARALVRRPAFLILDEPTNGLDLAAEEAFLHVLADLHVRDRLTIIFVTHDVTIAARYATHVALFHSAGLESGPREAILRPATLARAYGVAVEVARDASGTVALRVGPRGADR